MLSFADRVGSRLKLWKTKPTRSRRSTVSRVSSSPVRSVAPSRTLPEVGWSSPARQCMRVDLPDPDGPMIAVNARAVISMSTPRKAWTCADPRPKVLVSPRALSAVRTASPPEGVARAAVVVNGA